MKLIYFDWYYGDPTKFKKFLQLRMQLELLPKSLKAHVWTGAFDCPNVLHIALLLSYQEILGLAFSKKKVLGSRVHP